MLACKVLLVFASEATLNRFALKRKMHRGLLYIFQRVATLVLSVCQERRNTAPKEPVL